MWQYRAQIKTDLTLQILERYAVQLYTQDHNICTWKAQTISIEQLLLEWLHCAKKNWSGNIRGVTTVLHNWKYLYSGPYDLRPLHAQKTQKMQIFQVVNKLLNPSQYKSHNSQS